MNTDVKFWIVLLLVGLGLMVLAEVLWVWVFGGI